MSKTCESCHGAGHITYELTCTKCHGEKTLLTFQDLNRGDWFKLVDTDRPGIYQKLTRPGQEWENCISNLGWYNRTAPIAEVILMCATFKEAITT